MKTEVLITKIARLYYEDGQTQAAIAKELGLTRLKVIELLKTAKSQGIVRIQIVDPKEDYLALEQTISQKYGLKRVIIVPDSFDNSNLLLGSLGKAASSYLNEILKPQETLGVGWGLSVLETSKCLENYEKRDITVVPLIGGGCETLIQYDVNGLAKRFSKAFGGVYYSLYASAIVDNQKIRDTIVSDSRISRIYNLWNQLDVALIGIGAMTTRFPDSFCKHLETQPINFEDLEIVGDILCQLYDINGNHKSLEMHARMIGINFETIKKANTVIAVAGGLTKLDAILGAIRGRIINVLITDETVANSLLS